MPICYGFGAYRVDTVTLLTITTLPAKRSCGTAIARFSGHAATFRSWPTVFASAATRALLPNSLPAEIDAWVSTRTPMAESKKTERLISGDIGDWLVAEPIEKCEHRIENDEDRRRRAEEDRPAGGHCAVIAVGPNAVGEAAHFKFARTYANEVPSAMPLELDLFRSLRQSGQALGRRPESGTGREIPPAPLRRAVNLRPSSTAPYITAPTLPRLRGSPMRSIG